VALNDLDGDGLPNDVCYVDVRTDEVIVAPVPGTGLRFRPFALWPSPLPYDSTSTAPMGCLPGDLNEDGTVDLLVYYWGRTPVAFLARGRADTAAGTLNARSYVPQEVTSPQRWYTNAATLTDVDGDGHADLVIANYFPDGARILDANARDARESMQHSMSRAFNGGAKHLLLWAGAAAAANPAVHYKEVPGAFADVNHGWTLAVGAADLDGDLLPEVYFANDFGPDRLLHNRSAPGRPSFALLQGRRTLATPTSKVLGRDSFKGMGVDFGDIGDRGSLTICVSNIADEYALEESHFLFVPEGDPGAMRRGVAPYVDVAEKLGLSRGGWGWDCRFGDFDNDGTLEVVRATGFVKGLVNRWPELHELAMGNDELLRDPRHWPQLTPGTDLSGHEHNPFFVRARDGRYYDLAEDIGLGDVEVTRGIATADVDADGRLDFATANQWATSRFMHNESSRASAFLGLRLRLPVAPYDTATGVRARPDGRVLVPSRAAIGAAATVHLADGRMITAQVDGGNGHSGKRSNDLHFGLGRLGATDSVRVELKWRDVRGAPHAASVFLRPGWHVLLLGTSSEPRDD
jgi:hypothetical protein